MSAICCEPAIPRRKKHPELAYRTNEVLRMVNGGDSSDSLDTESVTSRDVIENRARPEERSQIRNRVSPRSKSVDPYLGRRRPMSAHLASKGSVVKNILATDASAMEPVQHRLHYARRHFDTSSANPVIADKFAWPRSSESTPLHESTPRKSISMGAIQVAQQALPVAPAQRAAGHSVVKSSAAAAAAATTSQHHPIPGPRTAAAGLSSSRISRNGPHVRMEDSVVRSPPPPVTDRDNELPNVDHEDVVDQKHSESRPRKFKTEYKSKFRAPSKYAYVEGSWKKMSRSADSAELQKEEPNSLPWYGEVIELRKKAGEYKHRSLGGNLANEHLAELYSRQDIFEQLSTRSNLSALALATTPSSWKKPKGFDGGGDELINTPRSQSVARHHLERTTPAAGEMGVLITSPTRDHKLEPVETKRSVTESKSSPDKTKPSPKASPRLVESQLATKTITKGVSAAPTVQSRSASAGPVHRSPKRTPRPVSMIVPGSKAQVNGVFNGTGTTEPPTTRKVEPKRPRPSIDSVDNELTSDESKEIEETLMMKSPPEPTRVKSPEQILVRSPEPVKWTIPLETGIKWTGTPKIEGESYKMGKEECRSPPSIVSSPVDTLTEPVIPSQEIDVVINKLENLASTNFDRDSE